MSPQHTRYAMITNTDGIQILFADQILVSDLFTICLQRRRFGSVRQVRYFEPMDGAVSRWLSILRWTGGIHAEFRRNRHHIGEVRDNDGASRYGRIYEDVLTICTRIRKEQIDRDPLIREMGSVWSREKIAFHFEKLAELHVSGQIYMEVLRICLVEWILENSTQWSPENAALMIRKKRWFRYLKGYASAKGISLIGRYRPEWRKGARSVQKSIHLTAGAAKRLSRPRPTSGARCRGRTDTRRPKQTSNHQKSLAIGYTGGKISFDPAERSEFFWLDDAGIPFERVVVYNFYGDQIRDKKIQEQINRRHLRIFGRGENATPWHPTKLKHKTFIRTVFKILTSAAACLRQGRYVSPYVITELVALARDYSHWFDFYTCQQVALNVSPMNATTVGQVLAVDAIQGLSFAYQYSVSNTFPTTFVSSGENVQFGLSDFFKGLWEQVEAPTDHFVKTGFIYDGVAGNIRRSERIGEIRRTLRDGGARFIICFFDENSIDRWDMPVPHRLAADDYAFLLNWLLEDSRLGLIFKPKRSNTLHQRIGHVTELIKRAVQTGRCVFFGSDTAIGGIYPAETALMSDLCIGKLSGATAALEARMAGKPSLLIDTEVISWHPFYRWGKGRVVFNSWSDLRRAVERYREDPETVPGFGDWSPGIKDFDPYGDGMSSARMGSFIRWAYDRLSSGRSPHDALGWAVGRYEKEWGQGGC